jgi:hypothetical protein
MVGEEGWSGVGEAVVRACDGGGRIEDDGVVGDVLVAEIGQTAPHAQNVLMGYPRIVADDLCPTADFDTLNALADDVRDKQAAKVAEPENQGVKVAFADPVSVCRSQGAEHQLDIVLRATGATVLAAPL